MDEKMFKLIQAMKAVAQSFEVFCLITYLLANSLSS